jgi:carboxyl-terminal processing protease
LKNEYEALKAKLSHNKQEDVQKNKDEIVNLIEEEITSRYYYQSGRIRESLTHDTDITKALEVLGDSVMYTSVLNGTLNSR